jgi:ankyrin repeat protein
LYNFSKEPKKSAYSHDLEHIEREKLAQSESQQESNKNRTVKLDLIGFEETHPLLRAAFLGDFQLAKDCILRGMDVNYHCNVNAFTALQLASQEGHTGSFAFFILSLSLIHPLSLSLTLMFSFSVYCIDIVKLLLDNGAQINARNRGGDTALALACLKNKKGFSLVLLSSLILLLNDRSPH